MSIQHGVPPAGSAASPFSPPPGAASAAAPLTRVGVIGLGEVGAIFGAALREQGLPWVGAWDVLALNEAERVVLQQRAAAAGVTLCPDLAALCAQAELLISAVTAGNTLAAAQAAATELRPGTWYLDLNSASPATKQAAAAAIEAAGGRYVEAGVMTSVPPYGIRVPMLIGGPHAAALQPVLQRWGMQVQVASEHLGVASATKMCRSVMIKGLEALVIESFTAARHYGVEEAMIATLQETFPGIDWPAQAAYFYRRVAQHGRRRAEEMREVARTVAEAGFEPQMASATADKDDWMAALARAGAFGHITDSQGWQHWADALLASRLAVSRQEVVPKN
ncbi:NAD(P)-dependent oxidoreductase [Tepidimonas charontis]|uniref:HIBADH: 3-hydroxyisobutyrate dehydrogenase n=1 Tax=Tepidimonas charontis TaxID=2267262 RepID=A0A554XGN7_9BURK|nr:NAD(P)-dependent oxidoreductase [Tepidimonas charontis]TSE34959.1 HIBADH: 3-hydroxyisobutyrate dehydrogenase [Tepidimonas charontis]